jgi:hypothetical protein
MTVEAQEVEGILHETVAALSRLDVEELEELERRASRLAESFGAEKLPATRGLRAKVNLLEGCLSGTAENLKVLRGLRERKAAV